MVKLNPLFLLFFDNPTFLIFINFFYLLVYMYMYVHVCMYMFLMLLMHTHTSIHFAHTDPCAHTYTVNITYVFCLIKERKMKKK